MAYRSFRRLLFARSLNTVGNSVQIVAAGWLVYHLSGSALNVGLLGVVALASSLLGSPLGGVLTDRFAVRRMAVALLLLQVIPAAVMAILAFSGSLTVPLIDSHRGELEGAKALATANAASTIVPPPVTALSIGVVSLASATNLPARLLRFASVIAQQSDGAGVSAAGRP